MVVLAAVVAVVAMEVGVNPGYPAGPMVEGGHQEAAVSTAALPEQEEEEGWMVAMTTVVLLTGLNQIDLVSTVTQE